MMSDDFANFSNALSHRSLKCLLGFFYGRDIFLQCNEEIRAIFELCLKEYRLKHGDGSPVFPLAVAALSEAELLRIPNLGRKSVREIADELAKFGLHPGAPVQYLLHRFTSIGWEWNLMEAAA